MARNIEIKARIDDLASIRRKVETLADDGPIEIIQDDTFFNCESGRLKLRKSSDDKGELIFYQRSNQCGPKESFYVRTPTSTPEKLIETLSLAYGKAGRLQKHRTLFMVGRTRIHLDQVLHLGNFMELEVVLNEHESIDTGTREANELMRQLDIDSSQLIEAAYVDLLSP